MTVRPDGTGLAAVTELGLDDQRVIAPSWTPEGDRIVFTLVDGFQGEQIPIVAFVNDDGTGLARLGFGIGSSARLRPTATPVP
jgi:hypothetical protein